MGKFNCFVLNKWEIGMQQLIDGNDAKLKDLAERTLLEKHDTAENLKLADEWWEFSNTLSGRRGRIAKRFVASIYEKALPELNDGEKKRAEDRLAAAEKLMISPTVVSSIRQDNVSDANKRSRVQNRPNKLPIGTTFGKTKLTDIEIKHFLDSCRAEKARLLEGVQQGFNARAAEMTPWEVGEAQKVFEFLSKDNVLIVPRGKEGGVGAIFKPTSAQLSVPYTSVETQAVIDKNSVYIRASYFGQPVILEGVDTTQVPPGRWPCYMLFRFAGTKKIPGIIGEKEIEVYQAVSDEGFPKDIILW
jgi:hypothetical protein